ncbi:MAG: DMT family transporter [Chitinophagaceae bacterium]|nr:DMT family transporter [Chitinophagaceae bacterium]
MKASESASPKKKAYLFAVLATLIWSGNFIVARSVTHEIPPFTLAFYRWFCASVLLLPFTRTYLVKSEWKIFKSALLYFFITAFTGITLFNTLIYVAGYHTSAINMALLGTCSSPVFALILARIFLKENITAAQVAGMLISITGVMILLSRGSLSALTEFRFGRGELWILAAAFSFAIYNTCVKKKPLGMKPIAFLCIVFFTGTLLLLPFYVWEYSTTGGIRVNLKNLSIIFYLGAGASVLSFFLWNKSIQILGAAKTALFGNLIPVFSSMEAILLLGEKISIYHLISFGLVVTGLLLANRLKK